MTDFLSEISICDDDIEFSEAEAYEMSYLASDASDIDDEIPDKYLDRRSQLELISARTEKWGEPATGYWHYANENISEGTSDNDDQTEFSCDQQSAADDKHSTPSEQSLSPDDESKDGDHQDDEKDESSNEGGEEEVQASDVNDQKADLFVNIAKPPDSVEISQPWIEGDSQSTRPGEPTWMSSPKPTKDDTAMHSDQACSLIDMDPHQNLKVPRSYSAWKFLRISCPVASRVSNVINLSLPQRIKRLSFIQDQLLQMQKLVSDFSNEAEPETQADPARYFLDASKKVLIGIDVMRQDEKFSECNEDLMRMNVLIEKISKSLEE